MPTSGWRHGPRPTTLGGGPQNCRNNGWANGPDQQKMAKRGSNHIADHSLAMFSFSGPFPICSWSTGEKIYQRTMTVCGASLSRGNLGHGHRLSLSKDKFSEDHDHMLPWAICRNVLEDFCCINFGGFSWRIFLGTFSHKNEEKKSGEKIREKIRRLKNKNPRKIHSAESRP